MKIREYDNSCYQKKVKMADNLGTLVAALKIFQKSSIKSSNPHLKDFSIIFCEILSGATTLKVG